MEKGLSKELIQHIILFLTGGFIYVCMELGWRGYSHWTMFILGGLCFVIVGSLNEYALKHYKLDLPLAPQMIVGGLIITLLEYITGYIVNIKLGWNVWDYSDRPFNLDGQICLGATILWILISLLIIVIDDYMRYKLFGDAKRKYKMF